jgi:hypothetical protein
MRVRKSEKGEVALNDYMIAIVLFMLGATMVSYMYLQIYKLSAKVKIDEAIIGYVTEICEQIDMENYENVSTVEQVNNVINKTLENTPIKDLVEIKCTEVEKFSEKYNVNDYVERIHLTIKYTSLNQNARNYTINKLKVKEI